jgi:hypothetical protein
MNISLRLNGQPPVNWQVPKMPTLGLISNANTNGFLSNDFPHGPPKLYITAESDDFDELTIQEWRNEGFKVEYVSMGNGGREYGERLEKLSRTGLGVGETMGIVGRLPLRFDYDRSLLFLLK